MCTSRIPFASVTTALLLDVEFFYPNRLFAFGTILNTGLNTGFPGIQRDSELPVS